MFKTRKSDIKQKHLLTV